MATKKKKAKRAKKAVRKKFKKARGTSIESRLPDAAGAGIESLPGDNTTDDPGPRRERVRSD